MPALLFVKSVNGTTTLSSNKILLPQICACGCGQEKKPDKDGRIRGRFIKGHCKAEKHPSWKGGVQIVNGGYRLVYAPGHPMAQKDGYVLEHRKVMYEIIGRTLTRDEDVHHINGIKTDNRPQNLQLLSKSEHHKFFETTIQEMSLRLDWQRKSIHDRVAGEKAKEEAALKKKKQEQKEEEESATPSPAPASK